MGVAIRRYIIDILHNNYLLFPTPLVLHIFLAAASLLVCSFLKCFFISFKCFFISFKMFFYFLFVIFVQYSKSCSKNIRDHSKIVITGI